LAKKARLVAERKSSGCQVCRYKGHPTSLDFHHIEPSQKKMGINRGFHSGSLANFTEELGKCVVLCANCHRNVHAGEINLAFTKLKHRRRLLIELNI